MMLQIGPQIPAEFPHSTHDSHPSRRTKLGVLATITKRLTCCGCRIAQRNAICPPSDQPHTDSGSLNCADNSSTMVIQSKIGICKWRVGMSHAIAMAGQIHRHHAKILRQLFRDTAPHAAVHPQPCISNSGAPLPPVPADS